MKNTRLKQGLILRALDESGRVFLLEKYSDSSYSLPLGVEGGLVSLLDVYDGFDGAYLCLVFNDKAGKQIAALQNYKSNINNLLEDNVHMFLAGTYYNEKNEKFYIHSGGFTKTNDVRRYTVCFVNGQPTNVIRLDDGTLLMFCVSTTGFNLYEATPDKENSSYVKGKLVERLRVSEDNGEAYSGRWGYATQLHILNRAFLEWFDNDMLRLMRNEIYARYGLSFKSPDLRAYFEARPWYTKLDRKENVTLFGMDLYNVNLIKMVENEPKRQVDVTEPGF